MAFDTSAKRIIKCDFCDGDPACVKSCDTQAIQYVDASVVSSVKQRAAAEKFSGIMRKVATAIASM